MAVEDKDFIMRQVRQLAEVLGSMLSKESIKELLIYEQTETERLNE